MSSSPRNPPTPLILPPPLLLVGNGPSVLARNLGVMIDQYPSVVRFNNYMINGFEDHVGTKTTYWSCCGSTVLPHHGLLPDQIIWPHGDKGRPPIDRPTFRIPAHFRELFDSEWKALNPPTGIHATSGCFVVAYLIHLGHRPTLFGFDHFDKTYSTKHHYWVPHGAGVPAAHNSPIERQLFQEWTNRRLISRL